MDNIRDGNTSVYCLKKEIKRQMEILDKRWYRTRIGGIAYTSRVQRQFEDGEKFLAMLDEMPYCNCKTVDELKQRISKKRNKLKSQLVELDEGENGHQISVFEILEPISEREKEERTKKIADLNEEIHWLHKCLGICKNKDYFK